MADTSKFLTDYGNLSIIYFIESKIDKKDYIKSYVYKNMGYFAIRIGVK